MTYTCFVAVVLSGEGNPLSRRVEKLAKRPMSCMRGEARARPPDCEASQENRRRSGKTTRSPLTSGKERISTLACVLWELASGSCQSTRTTRQAVC